MIKKHSLFQLLHRAFQGWMSDEAPRMGAALAFYTVFSLAPLLIIVITVGGFFFGQSIAQDQIMSQIRELIGREGSEAVATLIHGAQHPVQGVFAAVVGVATLLIGATGALMELQDGLNRVWNVRSHKMSFVLSELRHRMISLALIVGIAFLLLVSLVVSTVLSAFGAFLTGYSPLHETLWHSVDFFMSWGVITGLFAIIYKTLPDIPIRWSDVWMGAASASILFTLGKFLVGFYIGKSGITSTYGAAGSFVVVLMWVYYSSLLLYYGAEFTKVYADRYGSAPSPLS